MYGRFVIAVCKEMCQVLKGQPRGAGEKNTKKFCQFSLMM